MNDTERKLKIATEALLQISRNTVNGKRTMSAHTAICALQRMDRLPRLVPEVGVSFIRL